MSERLAGVAALELFLADGFPELVDRLRRVGVGVSSIGSSRCSAQSRKPRLPGEVGVVGDEVHLGVVEERVLVQVGGAESEPGVVDDRDLCVDVDGIARSGRQRA